MAPIQPFRFNLFRTKQLHLPFRKDRFQHLYELIQKREEDSWSKITPKTFWTVADTILLGLFLIPFTKEGGAGIVSHWVGIGSVILYIATSLWRYTRYAPLTKWGKIRTNSLCGGLAMICAASYLLLFKELTPEKVQAMYVVIALGTAALLLFAYALRRYRQVRSEATYNAEQIRRRIARRKRMELL